MPISTIIETKYGEFTLNYHSHGSQEGVTIVYGDITQGAPLVRVHSSCLFSEALNAIDCDCKLQLDEAMRAIAQFGSGVIVYIYQEGRGVGLANKIRAVEVMRTEKCDTATSFEKLNFELDPRTYELAVAALDEIGTSKTIQLLSNNPRKSKALQQAGYEIIDRVTLSYEVNEMVQTYLLSKQDKLGHLIDWQKIKSKAS